VTLQEYSWVAQIISSIVNILLVGVSTSVAVYVYRWHRESAKVETIRRLSEDLRHYNELVLSNEDLQELATENHPWGKLQKDDIRRMYRYFTYLNIAVNMFEARARGAVDMNKYESHINNTANLTFKDREFIKQHVLPCGYAKVFREELLYRWERIDRGGSLGPVYSGFQVGAIRYPQWRNHPRISSTVLEEKAAAKAASRSSKVRGLSERRRDFTLDQQFSIGLRSGE
jgi:hypothetical protein